MAINLLNSQVLEEMKQHEGNLNRIVQGMPGNEQGVSYVTKKEMEEMLESHFKRVESVIVSTFKQELEKEQEKTTSTSNSNDELKKGLEKEKLTFKDNIDQRVQNIKDGVVGWKNTQLEKVDDVKEHVKEAINKRIEALNERVRDMTAKIEQSLTIKTLPVKEKEQVQEKVQQNSAPSTNEKQSIDPSEKKQIDKAPVAKEVEKPKELSSVEKENQDLSKINKELVYNNNRYRKALESFNEFAKQNPEFEKQFKAFQKTQEQNQKLAKEPNVIKLQPDKNVEKLPVKEAQPQQQSKEMSR